MVCSLPSLSFCFSDKILIFPPRIFSLGVDSLLIDFFSLHYPIACLVSKKMSVDILIFVSLCICVFFRAIKKKKVLFNACFQQFNHNSLCVIFFMFILLGCYWISWICLLIEVIKFGKYLTICYSNIFSAHPSDSNHIYVRLLDIILRVTEVLLIF